MRGDVFTEYLSTRNVIRHAVIAAMSISDFPISGNFLPSILGRLRKAEISGSVYALKYR